MGLLDSLTKMIWWKKGTPFYPINNPGFQSRLIGQAGEVWLDVHKPYLIYDQVPQLRTVIQKKALMHANMKIKLVSIKDQSKEKQIDELYKLLENPNPLEAQNKWIAKRIEQLSIYGNQFTKINKSTSFQNFPESLWNISPRYIAPIVTGKVFDQYELSEIIKGFKYSDGKSQEKTYSTDEIIYSKVDDIDDPVIGKCPLIFINKNLSNIDAAYKFRNRIMTKNGGIGMISKDSGGAGSTGTVPLKKDEKQRIYNEFINTHGIEDYQNSLLLTEASLKYTPFLFPTKSMALFEEVTEGHAVICDAYGMDIKLFSSVQTKFDDLRLALVKTYEDTIIPEADAWMQTLSNRILPENIRKDYKLVASFDHIKILQQNKRSGVEGIKSIIEALVQAASPELRLVDPAFAQKIIEQEIDRIYGN